VKNSSLHESEVEDYAPAQVFIGSDIEQDDYTSAVCFAYRDADEPTVDPDFRSIDIREKLDIVKDIAKRKLSEQERMILDLTYTSGFTFQKIGDLTNTTRSAAQLIHTKALRKIRCELMRTKRLLL
jgi:DNA-directed RNA polymerase specialized sigma subunit